MAAGQRNFGVCVLDGNGVAAGFGQLGGDRAVEAMTRAVYGLQQAGLKVIVVMRATWEKTGLAQCARIDAGSLLYHLGCGDADSEFDLLSVAEEYDCFFLSNADYGAAYACWKLPPRSRSWLQAGGHSKQIKYAVREDLAFAPVLPRHLAAPQTTQSAQVSSPGVGQRGGDGGAGGDAGPDELRASFVEVRRGSQKECLLCIHCEDPRMGLFQFAAQLATEVLQVGGESWQEGESDDPALGQALFDRGPQWLQSPYMLVTVTSGPHAGLRAVGLGSNLKKRRAAARLSLAATATFMERRASVAAGASCQTGAGGPEDPRPWYAGDAVGVGEPLSRAAKASMLASLVQVVEAALKGLA